jgi:hypothetical protein
MFWLIFLVLVEATIGDNDLNRIMKRLSTPTAYILDYKRRRVWNNVCRIYWHKAYLLYVDGGSRYDARERVINVIQDMYDVSLFDTISCNKSEYSGRNNKGAINGVATFTENQFRITYDHPEIRRFLRSDFRDSDIGCFGTKIAYGDMDTYRPEEYKRSKARRRRRFGSSAVKAINRIEQLERIQFDRNTGEIQENNNSVEVAH